MTARRLLADECGATAIEYALLAGFIAAVIVAAVGALGTAVGGFFDQTNTRFAEEIQAAPDE